MAFEDLDVWKRSAGLSVNIYKGLSDLKDYGFKDQITRSGLSIPSNIAEGMERVSKKEKKQFLAYAKGSCGELRTQIYIGIKITYISKEIGHQWIIDTQDISAMLARLIQSIKV
ncbi:MAG: four helix bundle protein [Methylococcales bacterium]